MSKKWVDIDKVLSAGDVPTRLEELDKLMKEKPNFDKRVEVVPYKRRKSNK